jgi:signal recognition particle subunit SRP72
MMGHAQELVDEYSKVISRNLADASSLAVATNNLIALRNGKEVADSLRKLDKLMSKGNSERPFELSNDLNFQLNSKQKEALYSNRVLLLLQANKIDQVWSFFPFVVFSQIYVIN